MATPIKTNIWDLSKIATIIACTSVLTSYVSSLRQEIRAKVFDPIEANTKAIQALDKEISVHEASDMAIHSAGKVESQKAVAKPYSGIAQR